MDNLECTLDRVEKRHNHACREYVLCGKDVDKKESLISLGTLNEVRENVERMESLFDKLKEESI